MQGRRRAVRWVLQGVLWAVVGWGIVSAFQNAAQQLDRQQSELHRQADSLERQAVQTEHWPEAERLKAQAEKLRRQGHDFWKADYRFLLLAGLTYILGMLPAAAYWGLCLRALRQPLDWRIGLWAYFYGNLGKYLPGKAMVIVLRLAALAPLGVRRVAAAMTVFMETLTMMAVGGAVAAGCLILLNLDWRLTLLACGLMLVTWLPTWPPLLRYLLVRLQRGVDRPAVVEWSTRLNLRLMVSGWIILGFTWVGFGLSLGCVALGLPSTELAVAAGPRFWLSIFGATALAVVLGFVSLVPGGAGVREVVLATVLTPVIGPTAALCCAVWLRVTWLAAELLMLVISFGLRRARFSPLETSP